MCKSLFQIHLFLKRWFTSSVQWHIVQVIPPSIPLIVLIILIRIIVPPLALTLVLIVVSLIRATVG